MTDPITTPEQTVDPWEVLVEIAEARWSGDNAIERIQQCAQRALRSRIPASGEGEVAEFVSGMKPLDRDLARIWDANTDVLYESEPITPTQPATLDREAVLEAACRILVPEKMRRFDDAGIKFGAWVEGSPIERGMRQTISDADAILSLITPQPAGDAIERARKDIERAIMDYVASTGDRAIELSALQFISNRIHEIAEAALAALQEPTP
jgi:hypothetical protein